jgi:hypothetical protein
MERLYRIEIDVFLDDRMRSKVIQAAREDYRNSAGVWTVEDGEKVRITAEEFVVDTKTAFLFPDRFWGVVDSVCSRCALDAPLRSLLFRCASSRVFAIRLTVARLRSSRRMLVYSPTRRPDVAGVRSLIGDVHHVCDAGLRRQTMYSSTLVSPISMPSLSSDVYLGHAPKRVPTAHPADHLEYLVRNDRPPGLPRPHLPGPKQPESPCDFRRRTLL